MIFSNKKYASDNAVGVALIGFEEWRKNKNYIFATNCKEFKYIFLFIFFI